jgi:hypothetical protein
MVTMVMSELFGNILLVERGLSNKIKTTLTL